MNFKRTFIVFSLFCFSLACVAGLGERYFNDSEYWPVALELKEAYTIDSKTLRPNRRSILIRLIDDESALIDFGRNGIYRVPLALTDFKEKFHRLENGIDSKRLPNLVEMIGPRLLKNENSNVRPLVLTGTDSSLVDQYDGFLFVYLPNSPDLENLAIESLKKIFHGAALEKIAVVVIPPAEISQQDLDQFFSMKGIQEYHLYYDFVTASYVKALQHQPEGKSLFVLSDAEGKILYRNEVLSFEKMSHHLKKSDKRSVLAP